MNLSLQLAVDITKHGRKFVAYSPALDISTSGKSEKEAKKRFEELVEIFFEEVNTNSNLETVLQELGWKKVRKQWQPPKISHGSVDVKIPAAA
jgi:hypothetical protein